MATEKLKIKCRIEETPTIGKFLLESLGVNLADFTGFSPDYNTAYITNGNNKLAAVTGVINPKQITA